MEKDWTFADFDRTLKTSEKLIHIENLLNERHGRYNFLI